MPNTTAPLSKPTTKSSPSSVQRTLRPSPLLYLLSPTCCNSSLSKFRTPAFLPVTRFHNRIDLSPLPTVTMSFILGCTAKSFTPAGTSPGAAVSPLGLPVGFGIGAFIVESTVQSRVRDIATVLSSAALNNLPLVGNCSLVTLRAWCSRLPNSRFLGFSRTLVRDKVGRLLFAFFFGGTLDTL